VWVILGNAYSIKMLSAEKFAAALELAAGNISLIDTPAKVEFLRNFPDLSLDKITLKQIQSIRRQLLYKAGQMYQSGFERSGMAFPVSAG